VGRLRQVVPEYLRFYFEVAANETLCESAELERERVPSLLRCSVCATEWDPAPPPARDGDEQVVESIDVSEPATSRSRARGGAAARSSP
jgi:Zn finger protein HypA/HybF involved in hydrogenase expression